MQERVVCGNQGFASFQLKSLLWCLNANQPRLNLGVERGGVNLRMKINVISTSCYIWCEINSGCSEKIICMENCSDRKKMVTSGYVFYRF